MDANSKTEHFKFNFRKLEFEATNPGKASTIHLCLIWGFIILALVIVMVLATLLKLNIWDIGVVNGAGWLCYLLRRKPP